MQRTFSGKSAPAHPGSRPAAAQLKVPNLVLPLAGDFHEANGAEVVCVQGPHRFLTIGNVTGYQPTSLKTVFHIATNLHLNNEGTIALWVSPLETLSSALPQWGFTSRDPNAQEYGLLADTFPINDPTKNIFGWYWRADLHPQMIAKFKNDAAGGAHADYEVTPYVPVESLPLKERQWYEFVLAWNKEKSRLYVYVNGILCGTTSYPFEAATPRPDLYLGNTAMAFANLRIYDTELQRDEVASVWRQARFPGKPEAEKEIAALHTIQRRPKVNWQRTANWKVEYDNSLCAEGSFAEWIQQGCLEPGFALKEFKNTPEGLLLETPDRIHVESRVYFWSPKIFEGDLAVELDFRPEREDGLALLVVQASGMQREDFINDHPPRTTGSMSTILGDRVRNYHWEFFRHCVDCRGDLGTSVLCKNPWRRALGLVSRQPFVVGEWYKLLLVQEDNHLRAGINGEWLLDLHDTAMGNNGPVFNCGRIGLRLMYQTRMRFRNLKVWNRQRETPARFEVGAPTH